MKWPITTPVVCTIKSEILKRAPRPNEMEGSPLLVVLIGMLCVSPALRVYPTLDGEYSFVSSPIRLNASSYPLIPSGAGFSKSLTSFLTTLENENSRIWHASQCLLIAKFRCTSPNIFASWAFRSNGRQLAAFLFDAPSPRAPPSAIFLRQ
jgi:hypothetical protein